MHYNSYYILLTRNLANIFVQQVLTNAVNKSKQNKQYKNNSYETQKVLVYLK